MILETNIFAPMFDLFLKIDEPIFRALHPVVCDNSQWFAKFASFVTHKSMYVWFVFALLMVLFRGPKHYFALFMIIGGFFFAWHFNDEILKPLFDRARPCSALTDVCLIGYDHCATGKSFPSGHTITSFAIAALIYLYSSRSWFMLVSTAGLAIFNGYLRIFAGVHYPTDIIAGALAGIAIAFAWYKFSEFALQKYKNK